jgi:hypothetical protein
MSLPSSQQRVLDRIESLLRDSDPRLTAMFVIFTRLVRDEEMPRLEEFRARLTRLRVWFSWRTARARRMARPSQRLRTILLFPAALVAMMCGLPRRAALRAGPEDSRDRADREGPAVRAGHDAHADPRSLAGQLRLATGYSGDLGIPVMACALMRPLCPVVDPACGPNHELCPHFSNLLVIFQKFFGRL